MSKNCFKCQLSMGKRVEAEHKGTVGFIRSYYKKHDSLPSNKAVFARIAVDHIKEHPNYYTKLKRAKL